VITYFLAVAALLSLDKSAPQIIAGYATKEQCEIAAIAANHSRSIEQRAKGLAAICLKIDGPEA
jgi:hypothetical protein